MAIPPAVRRSGVVRASAQRHVPSVIQGKLTFCWSPLCLWKKCFLMSHQSLHKIHFTVKLLSSARQKGAENRPSVLWGTWQKWQRTVGAQEPGGTSPDDCTWIYRCGFLLSMLSLYSVHFFFFSVWFIDDCHQHEAFNCSHMLNPSSPMFRLFRHTEATSAVCKRLLDTIFPAAVHFSTSLFKWADALLEHTPSASTGRALGSVLHCFPTIPALKESETADLGSNFRKKRSVRVFQANNKFLLICFDYLESSFILS